MPFKGLSPSRITQQPQYGGSPLKPGIVNDVTWGGVGRQQPQQLGSQQYQAWSGNIPGSYGNAPTFGGAYRIGSPQAPQGQQQLLSQYNNTLGNHRFAMPTGQTGYGGTALFPALGLGYASLGSPTAGSMAPKVLNTPSMNPQQSQNMQGLQGLLGQMGGMNAPQMMNAIRGLR